jgi:hypothetical protein
MLEEDGGHEHRLSQEQEVSAMVNPRSITLHQTPSESSARNSFRGEIVQIVPVSAKFAEGSDTPEGLMRVSILIDSAWIARCGVQSC